MDLLDGGSAGGVLCRSACCGLALIHCALYQARGAAKASVEMPIHISWACSLGDIQCVFKMYTKN